MKLLRVSVDVYIIFILISAKYEVSVECMSERQNI